MGLAKIGNRVITLNLTLAKLGFFVWRCKRQARYSLVVNKGDIWV